MMIRSRARLAAASLPIFALLLPLSASAQAPTPRPPVFGAEVEIINLNLTVTDPRGQYVTTLREEDFAVFEDGVRQELTLFNHEDLPISLSLVIDTSSSMDVKLPAARAAATRFVKTLRPQDDAQVVQFNDRTTTLQGFTADHLLLEAGINATFAAGPTAMYNALYVTLKELDSRKREKQARRRAIVILSDGADTASLVSDEQVIELARRAEINIYAIGMRPSRVAGQDDRQFSQATHFLTVIARDTGGQAHFPTSLSELDSVYDRIAQELRSQYNIGYVSSNGRSDGKWRRIVVRIPSREGVQVRHKLGYYAARTARR